MDPWSAFGGQDSSEEEEEERVPHCADVAIIQLKQHYWQLNPQIALADCKLVVYQDNTGGNKVEWSNMIHSHGFGTLRKVVLGNNDIQSNGNKQCYNDVAVAILNSDSTISIQELLDRIYRDLLPSGHCFLYSGEDIELLTQIASNYNDRQWMTVHQSEIYLILKAWPCQVQYKACPWLSTSQKHVEYERLASSTIVPSASELERRNNDLNAGILSAHSLRQAVNALNNNGYCIIRKLLDSNTVSKFGKVALQDLHSSATILKSNYDIDIYNPQNGNTPTHNYRELSFREDCRMDLRSGPALKALRDEQNANETVTIKATQTSLPDQFLRGNTDLLHIIRAAMHPTDSNLSIGNLGRCNFDGSGADGSCPDIRASPVGAIISLPGAADQAIHADTPHLFEHLVRLPAHYINIFTPGCQPSANVGQTALVHQSHCLDVAADFERKSWHGNVVRPFLDIGDVLLMDCRTWHFGLANTSKDIERPLLYSNVTLHWFNDPKNWDNEKSIFDDQSSV